MDEKHHEDEAKVIRCCIIDGEPVEGNGFSYPNMKKLNGKFGFDSKIFCGPSCAKFYLDRYLRDSPHYLTWLHLYCRRDLKMKESIPIGLDPCLLAKYNRSGIGLTIKQFRETDNAHKIVERINHIPVDLRVWEPEKQFDNPLPYYEVTQSQRNLADLLFQEHVESGKLIPKILLSEAANAAAAAVAASSATSSSSETPTPSSSLTTIGVEDSNISIMSKQDELDIENGVPTSAQFRDLARQQQQQSNLTPSSSSSSPSSSLLPPMIQIPSIVKNGKVKQSVKSQKEKIVAAEQTKKRKTREYDEDEDGCLDSDVYETESVDLHDETTLKTSRKCAKTVVQKPSKKLMQNKTSHKNIGDDTSPVIAKKQIAIIPHLAKPATTKKNARSQIDHSPIG